MKKRALWIFDENYLMLTYLSVSSFIDHCDVIATLIFCGGEINEADKKLFLDLDSKVEILHFEADVSQWELHMQANILNRLARLHYTRLYENDLLFMIDSDVSFSSSIKHDVEEFEANFQQESESVPMISGVVEFLNAKDAYLYFRKEDKHGPERKTTDDAKIRSYESLFGSDWPTLVEGFQFNNGFLIFHKARALIDQWEKYYLAGLDNEEINPLDDQVPLAVAIQKIGCRYFKMSSKWNSLGDLDGPFSVFHAWGGEWKVEIDEVLRNQKATSAYGEICKKYLPKCPDSWLTKFNIDLNSGPHRFRHILGAFDHGNDFRDLIGQLKEGHIVEVGTYKGRSACFVAELIKASGKHIIFDTIDHFERSDTSKQLVLSILEKAGVDFLVNVIEAHSLQASDAYSSGQLDFVILDTDSPANVLELELEAWYDKIKEGGILMGYDHSIHDTVYKGYHCVTSAFCEKHSIPLMTYEYKFIIRKPYKKHTTSNDVKTNGLVELASLVN